MRFSRQTALVLICCTVSLEAYAAKLSDFQEVDRGIYRGGHPSTHKDFNQLVEVGIKTILSLRYSSTSRNPERKMALKYGMNFFNVPISPLTIDLQDSKMIKILNIMQDESLKPLYMHCLFGHDRTGLAIGLYRIHVQQWTPEAAYTEMRQFQFMPILVWGLYKYFKSHTTPGSLEFPVYEQLGTN